MASARANLPCLVLSPLLLFSACEHSGPPDTEVLAGPLVDLHYSPEFEPCGGNVAAIDAFARFAAAVIGLEPDDLLHTRFYWLTDEDYESFLGEDCKDETSGCAGPRGAFSRLPIHHHELAHVVGLNLSRDAPRFLSEGFAEATDPSSGWPLGELDPREFLGVDGNAFVATLMPPPGVSSSTSCNATAPGPSKTFMQAFRMTPT